MADTDGAAATAAAAAAAAAADAPAAAADVDAQTAAAQAALQAAMQATSSAAAPANDPMADLQQAAASLGINLNADSAALLRQLTASLGGGGGGAAAAPAADGAAADANGALRALAGAAAGGGAAGALGGLLDGAAGALGQQLSGGTSELWGVGSQRVVALCSKAVQDGTAFLRFCVLCLQTRRWRRWRRRSSSRAAAATTRPPCWRRWAAAACRSTPSRSCKHVRRDPALPLHDATLPRRRGSRCALVPPTTCARAVCACARSGPEVPVLHGREGHADARGGAPHAQRHAPHHSGGRRRRQETGSTPPTPHPTVRTAPVFDRAAREPCAHSRVRTLAPVWRWPAVGSLPPCGVPPCCCRCCKCPRASRRTAPCRQVRPTGQPPGPPSHLDAAHAHASVPPRPCLAEPRRVPCALHACSGAGAAWRRRPGVPQARRQSRLGRPAAPALPGAPPGRVQPPAGRDAACLSGAPPAACAAAAAPASALCGAHCAVRRAPCPCTALRPQRYFVSDTGAPLTGDSNLLLSWDLTSGSQLYLVVVVSAGRPPPLPPPSQRQCAAARAALLDRFAASALRGGDTAGAQLLQPHAARRRRSALRAAGELTRLAWLPGPLPSRRRTSRRTACARTRCPCTAPSASPPLTAARRTTTGGAWRRGCPRARTATTTAGAAATASRTRARSRAARVTRRARSRGSASPRRRSWR